LVFCLSIVDAPGGISLVTMIPLSQMTMVPGSDINIDLLIGLITLGFFYTVQSEILAG
jgi:hypothetical protein